MNIEIKTPEIEVLINERLKTGVFKDAEDVILQALRSSKAEPKGKTREVDENRRGAIERLMNFGEMNGLSLGAMTIRELREEARP